MLAYVVLLMSPAVQPQSQEGDTALLASSVKEASSAWQSDLDSLDGFRVEYLMFRGLNGRMREVDVATVVELVEGIFSSGGLMSPELSANLLYERSERWPGFGKIVYSRDGDAEAYEKFSAGQPDETLYKDGSEYAISDALNSQIITGLDSPPFSLPRKEWFATPLARLFSDPFAVYAFGNPITVTVPKAPGDYEVEASVDPESKRATRATIRHDGTARVFFNFFRGDVEGRAFPDAHVELFFKNDVLFSCKSVDVLDFQSGRSINRPVAFSAPSPSSLVISGLDHDVPASRLAGAEWKDVRASPSPSLSRPEDDHVRGFAAATVAAALVLIIVIYGKSRRINQ